MFSPPVDSGSSPRRIDLTAAAVGVSPDGPARRTRERVISPPSLSMEAATTATLRLPYDGRRSLTNSPDRVILDLLMKEIMLAPPRAERSQFSFRRPERNVPWRLFILPTTLTQAIRPAKPF